MKREIPNTTTLSRTSPVFTEETVPKGLLKDHNLKAGTWGSLIVEQGQVAFYLAGMTAPEAEINAGERWTILPEEKHFIRVHGEARFYIEFYK